MNDLFSTVTKDQLLGDVSKLERIDDWDEFFLGMAFHAARKSKDPSTKTGCVLVRDRRQLAIGYNGFPCGAPDDPVRYLDREFKYKAIVHCDTNSLYSCAKLGIATDQATMYLTGPPCSDCTKGIINCGIVRVVWPKKNKFEVDGDTSSRWAVDCAFAQARMTECGVVFNRWEPTS